MKAFSILGLLLFFSAIGMAQDEYKSGVLVLTDGRLIAIRGEYEVLGTEVQFTGAKGKLMTLPLSMVDLEATDTKNKEIDDKNKPDEFEDDGSLYSKVMKFRRESGKDGKGAQLYQNQVGDQNESGPMDDPLEQLQAQLEELNIDFEKAKLWLAIFAIVITLAYLVTFFTQIYLIYRAYGDSALWGLGLNVVFLAPIALSWLGTLDALSEPGTILFLGFASIGTTLLSIILFPAYVFVHCFGSRLKLISFLALPLILFIPMAIMAGVAMATGAFAL